MKEFKEVKVAMTVNVDKLIAAYTEDMAISENELPNLEEMIEHELGWLEASGISVNQIVVIK